MSRFTHNNDVDGASGNTSGSGNNDYAPAKESTRISIIDPNKLSQLHDKQDDMRSLINKYPPVYSPTDALSPCSQRILRKTTGKCYKQTSPSIAKEILDSKSTVHDDSDGTASNHTDTRKKFDLESSLPYLSIPTEVKHLPLVLGTSSSSRRRIIDLLGWQYVLKSPDIDEKAIRIDDHLKLPVAIAIAKADALFKRFADGTDSPISDEFMILTADQIVVFKDTVREKPISEAEAAFFLLSYSNETVSTVSAIVLTHYPSGKQVHSIDVATVAWYEINENVVSRVINRGEIYSSAGGFRVEDTDLNGLIKDMDGTMDSIMGMPVQLTVSLMRRLLL